MTCLQTSARRPAQVPRPRGAGAAARRNGQRRRFGDALLAGAIRELALDERRDYERPAAVLERFKM